MWLFKATLSHHLQLTITILLALVATSTFKGSKEDHFDHICRASGVFVLKKRAYIHQRQMESPIEMGRV